MYNSIYLKVEILISQRFMEFEVLTSRTKFPKRTSVSYLITVCN